MDILAALINNTPDAIRFFIMDVIPYSEFFTDLGYTVFEDGSIIP